MTILVIILAVIIVVIYLFQSDKKTVIETNLKNGGLIAKFPNFVSFCTSPLSMYEEMKMELFRDTGRYLEYKMTIRRNNQIRGYINYGLENSFGTFAYCYATSTNGYKTKKPFVEIKNRILELDEFEYRELFDRLLKQAFLSCDYRKLNFDLD